MSEYVYDPAVVEGGNALLLSQFADSTTLRLTLAALLGPNQEIEDALAVLYSAFDVDTADGVLLDIIGAIVGEPRRLRGDSEYRAYVRARIAANKSDGGPSDIYAVARLVLGTVPALRIVRTPPAAYRLHVTGATIAFPWDSGVSSQVVAKALVSLLADATSAGVGYGVLYQATDDANTFTYAVGDLLEADANQGYADDAMTVGGMYADLETGG